MFKFYIWPTDCIVLSPSRSHILIQSILTSVRDELQVNVRVGLIKCDPTVFASKLDKVIVRGSRGKWGSKGSLWGGGGFKAYFRLYYVKLISLNFPKGSWHPPFPFDPRMEIMAGTWRDKLMDRAISNISFKHFKTNISNECKTI